MSIHIQIKQLTVFNFRCYKKAQWNFTKRLNLLVGENGSGKTSILEAIYLMAHGRSFRQSKDAAWQQWGASNFQIDGQWQRYGPLHLHIQGKNKKLKISLQQRSLNLRKELKETFPVLINSPQGARLIDADHNERRKWLDQIVMYCEPQCKVHYQSYLRAWMQRSRLLRQDGSASELMVWEEQMVIHGHHIQNYRHNICQQINSYLRQEKAWTEQLVQCKIKSHIPQDKVKWLTALSEHRVKDKKTGRCFYGSHTDRLSIEYAQKEIRSVGSRGQQKLSSIAMKLAECSLRYDYTQMWPLLLLDDCFEALDKKHTRNVLQRLLIYSGQILLTTPHNIELPEGIDLDTWHIEQ
ncbi:MAG: DNA replication and repair protein RecF [Mariprofundaceae bacterium]|nr:DNA replication and repair protein RecF [Mariprofundaceae bacterium]